MRTLLIIALLTTTGLFAQRGERVRAFKTAHITEALSLTPAEAEKFWPIYNKHEKEIRELRMSEREMMRRMDTALEGMSEKEADRLLNESIDHKKQMLMHYEALVTELKPVLPNKKILLLQKAEEDFKRMLLNRMNQRQKKENRP